MNGVAAQTGSARRWPSVTVVVAARNAAGTINDCVGSLLELDYPPEDLELIVVDNASGDGTAGAVRRHGDRVMLLREARRGAGAARNAGIGNARGEVVAFTDADCVVDPGWLRHLVASLEDPGVGIAGGTIRALRPANPIELFGETIHDHRAAIEVYNPPYAITMNWASRRAVLEEVSGFDEAFLRCQDVDLSFRILAAGYRLAFAPGAVVHHRNERTLGGLFREGWVHGFHGVHARKRHAEFLAGHGHRRGGRPFVREIAARAIEGIRNRGATEARCEAAFDGGKKIGRLFGSVRFGRLDL